ncbi:MAG: hypothetical protein CM15mP32_2670 [Flavobacteriaceae bacterium]|nr:MAG: hypothetical protein CM15mP32_2670 [Flavobacteriaceae bacterium]
MQQLYILKHSMFQLKGMIQTRNRITTFLTINNAINAMGASGGTCIIREGYYHESIFMNNKDNIIIKAFLMKKLLSTAPSQSKQLGLKVLLIQIFTKLF